MRRLPAILFAVACCWSVPVAAEAPSKLSPQDRVAHMLTGYEWAPDIAALESATPTPAATLLAIRADLSYPLHVRVRALDALGLFPSLSVRGHLHRTARDPLSTPEERYHAATALVFAYGDGAVSSVESLLRAADATLKLTVADALVRHGGAASRRLVQRAAAHEKDRAVAAELRVLLRPLAPAAGPTLR